MDERILRNQLASARKRVKDLEKENAELRRKIAESERRKAKEELEVMPSYTGSLDPRWSQAKQEKLESSDLYFAHVMQQKRRKSWLD